MKTKRAKGLFLSLGFCIAAGSLFMTNMPAQAQTVYGKYCYVNGVMEGNVGRATLRNTSSTSRYGKILLYQCDADGDNLTLVDSDKGVLGADCYHNAIGKISRERAYAHGTIRANTSSGSTIADNIEQCWVK